MARLVLISALLAMLCTAMAGPDTEAFGPAQNAADSLRDAASTDIAFVAAGLIRSDFKGTDLGSLMQYPTDAVVVMSLTGAQIRQALERSVSLVPSPNPAFLQLSGIEATYSKSAAPSHRITDVKVGDAKLDDGKTYTVAMPGSLSRGGLGYFKVWKKESVQRTLEKTVEAVLKGATVKNVAARWKEMP